MLEKPNPAAKENTPSIIDVESALTKLNEHHTESKDVLTTETFLFFKDMLTMHGFSEYTDVNQAYETLPHESMIVRREDPRNVLKLFSDDAAYEVGFVGDNRYSNCVEWNPQTDGPRNLSNAYLEGYTNFNNLVTVIGIEKQADDDIEQLKDATQNFHGLNRQGVRSFTGTVTTDRVVFINLRVPGHLLAESELTEDEISRVDEYLDAKKDGRSAQPAMIHRCYIQDT